MKRVRLFFSVAIFLTILASIFSNVSIFREAGKTINENKSHLSELKNTLDDLTKRVNTLEQSLPIPVIGVASWYGDWEERAGNLTANGDRFRKDGYTVAHRSLPFGTVLLIENLTNGKVVPAIVNDRGPFIAGRDVDLTEGLARRLDFIKQGLVEIRYYALYTPVK